MRKSISLFFATAIMLVAASHILNAQTPEKCRTVEIRNQNLQAHPELQQTIDEIQEFTEQYTANYVGLEKAVVTIPVVVHVIWNSASENISYAQIQSQIEVLNKDFRKLNTDFSTNPAPFQAIGADIEIEFCLASKDPNGNATNGITRTQTSLSAIGQSGEYYSTAQGGHDSWDVNKYLNIWVCNPGFGILGFATPPGAAWPASSDGLVIGPGYFGTIGTAANSVPNHLGRTATHEIGHYFNLEHVWGPGNGGCNEDDYVTDTPNQAQENYGCPSFPHTDNCTSSGNGVNFNNYLDYVDDNCMKMFTQGQKVRMQACLNGPRASLKTSDGCDGGGSTNSVEDLIVSGSFLSIYPNPANDVLNVQVSDLAELEKVHFQLVDMVGKVHKSFDVFGTEALDVSELPAGVYFIQSTVFPAATQRVVISR